MSGKKPSFLRQQVYEAWEPERLQGDQLELNGKYRALVHMKGHAADRSCLELFLSLREVTPIQAGAHAIRGSIQNSGEDQVDVNGTIFDGYVTFLYPSGRRVSSGKQELGLGFFVPMGPVAEPLADPTLNL